MNWQICLAIICIIANAIFVAAEFSLVAARQDRLEVSSVNHRAAAQLVIAAKKEIPLMLSGCQLGITICSILLGMGIEPYIDSTLSHYLVTLQLGSMWISLISLVGSMIFVVLIHMLLAEMVPKNISLSNPERTAMVLIRPLRRFVFITRPIINFYLSITFFILKLCKITLRDNHELSMSPRQLSMLIDESHEAGLIDASEFSRLHHLFHLQEKFVEDFAVPLDKMVTITGETLADGRFGPPITGVEKLISATGFSRYPVVDAQGILRGYVHIKDILKQMGPMNGTNSAEKPLLVDKMEIAPVRPMVTFHTHTPINRVIAFLRKHNSHMGQIIAEDNSLVGIIALDDLIKLLVDTARSDADISSSAVYQ